MHGRKVREGNDKWNRIHRHVHQSNNSETTSTVYHALYTDIIRNTLIWFTCFSSSATVHGEYLNVTILEWLKCIFFRGLKFYTHYVFILLNNYSSSTTHHVLGDVSDPLPVSEEVEEGVEGRVEREPRRTSLCLALVRATLTRLQSQRRLPTYTHNTIRNQTHLKVS